MPADAPQPCSRLEPTLVSGVARAATSSSAGDAALHTNVRSDGRARLSTVKRAPRSIGERTHDKLSQAWITRLGVRWARVHAAICRAACFRRGYDTRVEIGGASRTSRRHAHC